MRKIGLIFGSFDPIHIGHISLATAALNNKAVEEVWLVPAIKNPWKENQTPYKHRYDMACLMISPGIKVSLIEFTRAGNEEGTYYVLQDLVKDYPDYEFTIITTPETYKEIPEWINGQKVLGQFKILTVGNKHFGSGDIQVPEIDTCSSEIRKTLSVGKNPIPFITKEVYEYILKHNLYGTLTRTTENT